MDQRQSRTLPARTASARPVEDGPRRPGPPRTAPLAVVGADTARRARRAGQVRTRLPARRPWPLSGRIRAAPGSSDPVEDGPAPAISKTARARVRTRRPGSPVSNPDRAGPVRVTAPTSSAYAPRARAPPAGAPAISPAQATRPGPARTGGGEFGPGRGWPAPDRADRPGTGRQPASLPGRPAGQRLRSPRPGQDRQSRRRRRPGPAPAAGLLAAPPWPVSGRFRAGERSAGGPRR